jgi:hypothetical protein
MSVNQFQEQQSDWCCDPGVAFYSRLAFEQYLGSETYKGLIKSAQIDDVARTLLLTRCVPSLYSSLPRRRFLRC